tara:strand:+ start:72 stop:911 length:840 start_codon:yes stop_codon:yes gene_type:complete
MNTLLNLKKDKLISILLKNNCIIYGAYVREVLIQNNKDFYKNYNLRAYTSKYERTHLERDLYDFNMEKNMDLEISSQRFNLVKYLLKNYKYLENDNDSDDNTEDDENDDSNNIINLNIIYMNRNPLLNNLVRPPIILDIDIIQLSRNGLSIDSVPNLYHYSPSPFLYILDNIKNKRFNLITTYQIYDISDFKYCRKLENKGWKNNDAKYKLILNKDYDDDCSICRTPLINKRCVKLNCNHYYHVECWDKHIEHQMKENVILTNIFCPLCRKEYSLKNII